MERKLSQLVERLKGAYQDRLVAVILYGSAAGGDHHPRFSDLNVLCVVKEISPRELAEAGPILRWWREHGNPAPLLLSAEEARNATDCFAIEFHDIQERRRVLYGEDVVGGI
jgi:predicted nucleotidyltransferase